jgi:hypothetical protein
MTGIALRILGERETAIPALAENLLGQEVLPGPVIHCLLGS